jgi:hypothetical protein
VDDPEKTPKLSITVQINPPHEGFDRFVGGAFVQDDRGRTHLAHSGKVGGRRKGVGPSAFLSFYSGGERAFVPERNAEMIILGRVDAPELAENLAGYAKVVAHFKGRGQGHNS